MAVDHEGVLVPGGAADDDAVPLVVRQGVAGRVVLDADGAVTGIDTKQRLFSKCALLFSQEQSNTLGSACSAACPR